MAAFALQQLAASFVTDGYCVMEDLFARADIDALHAFAMSNFGELMAHIEREQLELGIGVQNGFKEVVQRHASRYEMTHKMDMEEFSLITACAPLMSLVTAILGEGATIVNKSLVLSQPGALDQAWHTDGPHLSAVQDLPCHCLNVFVPLVDVEVIDGPTEIRPGSQFYTRDLAKLYMKAFLTKKLQPIVGPCLKRGSVLLFDYRTLHRGKGNNSQRPRPVLVFTFAKPWFKDLLNFPKVSIFDSSPLAARGAERCQTEGAIEKEERVVVTEDTRVTATAAAAEEEDAAAEALATVRLVQSSTGGPD